MQNPWGGFYYSSEAFFKDFGDMSYENVSFLIPEDSYINYLRVLKNLFCAVFIASFSDCVKFPVLHKFISAVLLLKNQIK